MTFAGDSPTASPWVQIPLLSEMQLAVRNGRATSKPQVSWPPGWCLIAPPKMHIFLHIIGIRNCPNQSGFVSQYLGYFQWNISIIMV